MTDLVAPRVRAARRRPRALSPVIRAAVPVAVLALWALASATGAAPPQIVPAPWAVVTAGAEIIASGMFGDYLLASLGRIGAGVGVGVSAGLLLGLVSGISTLGEELVDLTMQIVRAVPFLAVVPLFVAWFGIGDGFKTLFIAFAVVVPMYTYTFLSVRAVDPRILEAARSYGLRGPALTARVVLPQALPGVLMALRVCLSISVTALIAAENIGTREGLGYLVSLAQEYNRVDYMFFCLVVYAVLGVLFDLLVRMLERVLLPWRPEVAS